MATETDLGEVLELVRPITRRPVQAAPAKPLPAPVARIGPPTDESYPGWLRVLIVGTAAVAFWAALVFGAGYAVNVILAVWPA